MEEKNFVTQQLSELTLSINWERLPNAVRLEASRAWLNWVGCAIGGANTPSMNAAVKGILAMTTTPGTEPLLARNERVGLADAALLNCLSSSVQTFDDTHLSTITHPTGPVAAAALATAHHLATCKQTISGSALLTAMIVGMEIECRLSCAIAAGESDGGWFMTGLSGGVGAAAATGMLLGLSQQQMVYAFGLAAAQAAGIRATHGSMAIAYVPGLAARNGLTAAYMSSADFSCSENSIDGRNGLLQVLTGSTDTTLITKDLGIRFEVLNNTYKPYPCGIVIHPAIDACLEIAREHRVQPNNIERVELRVHPDALRLCWRKLPDNVFDAQVSLYHWAAAALARGQAGLAEGTLDCVHDPMVRALQSVTEASIDKTFKENQALCRVYTRDGERLEAFISDALGSVSNPMSDVALAAKFRAQTAPVLGNDRCDLVLQRCIELPTVLDASTIFKDTMLSN